MKELIKKAFDWYYEEDIAHTNISNEEATELFMETEHFKEMKYKAKESSPASGQSNVGVHDVDMFYNEGNQ